MKSCENCGVPLEKRPGVCLEFMAKYTDGPYNCWKPKEPEKTCGNCGHFEFTGLGGVGGICHILQGVFDKQTSADNKRKGFQDENCYWKPITCETCGGTGEVCKVCGRKKKDCMELHREGITYIPEPCPTCQPKEERLMMPVRWVDMPGYNKWFINPIKLDFCDSDSIARVFFIKDEYVCKIGRGEFTIKEIGKYKDLKQAKQAVEKALGAKK